MFLGLNLDGVFMPDFTTKLKKKMRSAPPVSLYFLEPVLQAEYQRFMPDFTTKFQKKEGQRSACTSMLFGTGFVGRIPAHIRLRISFY